MYKDRIPSCEEKARSWGWTITQDGTERLVTVCYATGPRTIRCRDDFEFTALVESEQQVRSAHPRRG